MPPLVVNTGKAIIANRLLGAGTEPKHVGWGTSATAEAAGQANLVAAAAEARVAGTSSRVTITTLDDTYQVVAQLTSASSQTIKEVALFDAATGGNMLMRAVHGDNALTSGDSITYTVKVQFT